MVDRRCFIRRIGSISIGIPVVSSHALTSWTHASQQQLEVEARENHSRYGNCAQSSFATLQEHFSLDGGRIFKALSPFPGIARRGETCGAVVGSMMALGLIFGRDKQDDFSQYLTAASIASEFCSRFENELGSTMCGDILESHLGRRFNLADPAEFDEFRTTVGDLCIRVVRTGVNIAAELIRKHRAQV